MWFLPISTVLLVVAYLLLNKKSSTQIPTNYYNETSEEDMSSSTIQIRPFSKLGGANHGWLNTRHHFSFADYFDHNRMNWGALRVINDDIIEPGTGFPPHPHRNMEIVSYLHTANPHPATGKNEGGQGIRHRDNTGSDGVTEPGDVQVMSVGSDGVVHSEYHPDGKAKESTNLFQIWIMPDKRVDKTTWGTRHFPRENSANKFATFASGFKEDLDKGALPINSYTRVVGVRLEHHEPVKYHLDQNRLAYAVVLRGDVKVNGVTAHTHDGIAIKDVQDLSFESASDEAEVLMVDTHP